MRTGNIKKNALKSIAIILGTAMLSGCKWVVMNPSGDVAMQQRNLILTSVGLMLLIVLPVIVATLLFAWRYRQANTKAEYRPDWDHSTQLELLIWTVPLLIIVALGAITWISTHTLDPYRALDRVGPGRPVPENVKPLVIQVVALDWKWLFLYPEQGIALVNEMAAPLDRPIEFKITSSSIMNSFFIPALAGQIYAMPGMETKLNAVINKTGVFDGFSANYSGHGFNSMRFKFHGLSENDFQAWIALNKTADKQLSKSVYMELEKPSERNIVERYAQVDASLYHAILNRCVQSDKMCMDEMMHIDAKGGMGKPGTYNVLTKKTEQGIQNNYVVAMCTAKTADADMIIGSNANSGQLETSQ